MREGVGLGRVRGYFRYLVHHIWFLFLFLIVYFKLEDCGLEISSNISSLRIEGNIQYIYIVQSKYTCQVTTSCLILLAKFLLIYSQVDD